MNLGALTQALKLRGHAADSPHAVSMEDRKHFRMRDSDFSNAHILSNHHRILLSRRDGTRVYGYHYIKARAQINVFYLAIVVNQAIQAISQGAKTLRVSKTKLKISIKTQPLST